MSTQAHTIRLADLQLVLVSAKALSQDRAMPVFCAMSGAPFHAVDCHKGRPPKKLELDRAKAGGSDHHQCRVSVMRRGHIVSLIEATQRRKGAAEVRRTWGAGVRALLAGDRHTLKRGKP